MTRFLALVAIVSFTSIGNGCNYGGTDPMSPALETDPIEILSVDNLNEDGESEPMFVPDDFHTNPFSEEDVSTETLRPSILPIEEEVGSDTLAAHAAWHTSVKVCPIVQVDNAGYIVASVRILHPDGTVSTTNSGDGRTPCVEVPLGGPYEISLPDECRSLGGRLVVPLGRMYRETFDGARTRRAPKFECYVRIGG